MQTILVTTFPYYDMFLPVFYVQYLFTIRDRSQLLNNLLIPTNKHFNRNTWIMFL